MLSLREANFSRMLLPFPDFKRTAVAFSPRPGFLVLGSSVKKVRVRNSPGNAGELSILVGLKLTTLRARVACSSN